MTAAPSVLQAGHGAATQSGENLPLFSRAANAVSRFTGRPGTFGSCCIVVIVWAATGPFFHYSDTWQLMINTGTTIVTFLMVFLIQNTQNRDGAALQAKLDELIRVTRNARNELVAVERQPEEMLDRIREDILRKAEGEIECTTLRSTVPSSGFPSFPS